MMASMGCGDANTVGAAGAVYVGGSVEWRSGGGPATEGLDKGGADAVAVFLIPLLAGYAGHSTQAELSVM